MRKGQAGAPARPRAQNRNHLPGPCTAAIAASGRAGTKTTSLARMCSSCCRPTPSPRPDPTLAWRQMATAQHWLLPKGTGHPASQVSLYISHQGLTPLQGHGAPLNTETAPYTLHLISPLPKQTRGISGTHLHNEMLINSSPCPAGAGSCSDTCQLHACASPHAGRVWPSTAPSAAASTILPTQDWPCMEGSGTAVMVGGPERENHSSNQPQPSTGAEP